MTKKQKQSLKLEELATKVANDISEGIDNGETRHQLRQCISWWADQYVKSNSSKILNDTQALCDKLDTLNETLKAK